MKKISGPGVLKSLPDTTILQEFAALYEAITAYVKKFYTNGQVESGGASQIMIEQVSAGVLLPWPQILDLLDKPKTRRGVLVMCIARTMLSRSLLLRLGPNNSPGATFLPPELVDCFQSFCSGKSATTLDGREPRPLDLSLLSRWKQISASLLYSTYVTDAFSPFDGRTVNIERAMEDLAPLLAAYAIPHDAGHGRDARLSELRDVLRRGAKFAFTLFSQPCLWTFNWYDDREIEPSEGQLEPKRVQQMEIDTARSKSMQFTLSLADIVIWPTLLKVRDGKRHKLKGEGKNIVGRDKMFLDQFLQ